MALLRIAAAVALLYSLLAANVVVAENPYRFFDWKVTYGNIYPLGVKQRGILINGQFPGPDIYSVTNDNLIINVYNYLKEPLLISWNGVQQRRNSWQDGVSGTNCPILPGTNYTYVMQTKDQIGSYFYFPSLGFQKAAGGFGGFRILSRPRIPVPFPPPADDFTVLIGDWYKADHRVLQHTLNLGHRLPLPAGILINGRGSGGASFTVQQGSTYRLRISNVGMQHSLNFRIQGHRMKLVEIEGTHTLQTIYSSIDVHVGQSVSVLVTADLPARDYYITVTSRFSKSILTATGLLHYTNATLKLHGTPPLPPKGQINWSLNQARSFRTNLTASGPRPNPQGSYHYGQINVSRTIQISSSAANIKGKQRYAVNGVSYLPNITPLKLADYFKIPDVFRLGSIPDAPPAHNNVHLATSVMDAAYRAFIEIVFENNANIVQSWHLDGYNFWVVGMDSGKWSPASRRAYNLQDAVSRSTTQVYPKAWTAIYVSLDNIGMWNLRSEVWARQYLGQQFYLRVSAPVITPRDEEPIPQNTLLCGKAKGQHIPTLRSEDQ